MPNETQLREIFDALGDGIFVADARGAYTDINPAGCRMLGYPREQLLKLSLADLLDPSEWRRLPATIGSFEGGTLQRSEWLFRRADGSTFVGELVGGRLPDGRFQSVVRDVSERVERERHERLLMGEAAHRTKNILALVQAIGRQTATSSGETFIDSFNARLAGLAASHDLFITSAWKPVAFEALARAQLRQFVEDEHRTRLTGPVIKLTPTAAQSIGMTLHELATNSVKYGALSSPAGHVELEWSIGATTPTLFSLAWKEAGGPPVIAPTRVGFGTRMIAQVMERAFGAKTTLAYESEGLRWSFECPLMAIAETNADSSDAPDSISALLTEPLSPRVLLFMDAANPELSRALDQTGLIVVGNISSVAELQKQVSQEVADVVIINYAAIQQDAAEVIDFLRTKTLPSVFIVDPDHTPTVSSDFMVVLRQPFRAAELASALSILSHKALRRGAMPHD